MMCTAATALLFILPLPHWQSASRSWVSHHGTVTRSAPSALDATNNSSARLLRSHSASTLPEELSLICPMRSSSCSLGAAG